jgi:hypothetical protein
MIQILVRHQYPEKGVIGEVFDPNSHPLGRGEIAVSSIDGDF